MRIWVNGTFRRLMRDSGLLKTAEGQNRILYSLRHTYATLELLRGAMDIQSLSRQGRVDDSLTPLQSGSDACNSGHRADPGKPCQICIVDVPARQIAEWGQLLSRPDEEATWNASIRAEVKQRMDQLLS